jgi:hypothetical protein
MRPLQTIRDASSALLEDISTACRRQPHWMHAGRLVLIASETGLPHDIQAATDALLEALIAEGWMSYADGGRRDFR